MQHQDEITDPCVFPGCLAPHAVDARICTTHTDVLRDALTRIVRVEDDLDTVISRQARLAEDTGGGHPADRPLPFHWDGSVARDELVNTVTTWARAVADSAGLPLDLDAVVVPPPPRHAKAHLAVVAPPARGSDGRRTGPARPTGRHHDDPAQLPYRPGPAARAAQWLLDQRRLRWFDDLGRLAEEVVYIASRMQHVIDRAPTRWYVGLCDGCHKPLYSRPESTFVVCRNPDCLDLSTGRPCVYEVDERREWLLEAAAEYMVTAAEASRAVPMLAPPGTPWNYSTFRSALGRVIAADRTHPDGHPRYRLGDCIAWAESRSADHARRVGERRAG
jgi:hypothetical protein